MRWVGVGRWRAPQGGKFPESQRNPAGGPPIPGAERFGETDRGERRDSS